MHADQLQIVLTKEQLQKAILVANDPTAGIFPIVSSAYDVGVTPPFVKNCTLRNIGEIRGSPKSS